MAGMVCLDVDGMRLRMGDRVMTEDAWGKVNNFEPNDGMSPAMLYVYLDDGEPVEFEGVKVGDDRFKFADVARVRERLFGVG